MSSCTSLSSRGKLYLDIDRRGTAERWHRHWAFTYRAHGHVQGLPAIGRSCEDAGGVLQLAHGGNLHLLHSSNDPAPASPPLHSQQQAPARSS
jgi:hypothetical protein